MPKSLIPAQLVLQSSENFAGVMPIDQAPLCFGEVIFNTSMTGYIETLTDPSYAGQILCFCYPLIGNYGVTPPDTWESNRIQVAGVIVSEFAKHYSHHAALYDLPTWLAQEKIPWIAGIDTRALTQCLRDKGVVMGVIASREAPVKFSYSKMTQNWVSQVSLSRPEDYPPRAYNDKKIIVVDCGIKYNSLRCLKRFPWRILRVPFDYDYSEENYDGIFLSNGPGDPALCSSTIHILQKALKREKPVFGICLGAQIMAHAIGAKTFKLPVGHRAQNQPCLFLPENRAYLTSQNHGFAINEASLPSDWQVLFRNLNDQTIAGINHVELPFFAVQFHPEAAPGPVETEWLFEKFWKLVST